MQPSLKIIALFLLFAKDYFVVWTSSFTLAGSNVGKELKGKVDG
jgi:hypothetical protein